MKVTVNVDCTPEEARAFLGLPNVEPLNAALVNQMQARMEENINSLRPEEFIKTWSVFGVQAQDHFLNLMQMAAQSASGGKSGS